VRLIVHDGDVIDGSGSVVTDGNVSVIWDPPGASSTTVVSNTSAVTIDDNPGLTHTASGDAAGFVIIRNSSSNAYNVGFDIEVL